MGVKWGAPGAKPKGTIGPGHAGKQAPAPARFAAPPGESETDYLLSKSIPIEERAQLACTVDPAELFDPGQERRDRDRWSW